MKLRPSVIYDDIPLRSRPILIMLINILILDILNVPADKKFDKNGEIMRSIFIVLGILSVMIGCVLSAPWFDLFTSNPGYHNRGNRPRQNRQGKSGSERWKEICRVITPDNYAFPGQGPYSSGPVCPW